VAAAKVFQGFAVHYGARRGIQPALKQGFGVGAGHRMEGIHTKCESCRQQLLNLAKVKQGFHQRPVVGDGVDHFDGGCRAGGGDAIQIDVRRRESCIP
jgi:hypothetical protein